MALEFDEHFPDRIREARKNVGLTQAKLAAKAETVSRQIAAYETGEARPRPKTLARIASALGTTELWLCHGIGNGPSVDDYSRIRNVKQIPLLDFESEIKSFLESGKIEQGTELHPIDIDVGDRTFAHTVFGNAMVSSGESEISLPDGAIVIIDPDADFISGNIALVNIYGLMRVKKVVIGINSVRLISLNMNEYAMEDIKIGELAPLDIFPVVKAEIYLNKTEISTKQPNDITTWERESNIVSNHYDDLDSRLSRIEDMLEKILNK